MSEVRPQGKQASVQDLEHALKRHRLWFLYHASAIRWHAAGHWEHLERAEVYDDGKGPENSGVSDSIFEHAEGLEKFAEAAYGDFGVGKGQPNVFDEGAYQYWPQWQIDEAGVKCLEQSADEVTRLALEVLSKHSPDWASREAVERCCYLARPDFPKWSAHRSLPWKYLEELDGGILAVRESALREQARRGTLPDRTFLKKIADETHRLIVSGDTERNAARARKQLHAAVELEDRYQEAGREWWRIWAKYLTKYEAGPRLGDKGAGPPAEGWAWVDDLATPMEAEPKGMGGHRAAPGLSFLIRHAVEPCGGWLPPPLLTPPELPPSPMPGHDSEKDTSDVILARAYLTLAVVHDNVDCVERRNRVRLLQGVNLHRPWVAATPLGHRSMQHTHMKGFDRESIEQALETVKADLHTLAGPVARDPTRQAEALREISKALRKWREQSGPQGRRPEDVPEEERRLAREALVLAVTNLELITSARDRYSCAEGVTVTAGVFDKLQTATAEHDRGTDLDGYWCWVEDLTQKHLPGNVSFPDELDRWASRLEQERQDLAHGTKYRDADKPKGQSGEWSAPLPLRVMMKRMDCENMDARTFKNWVKKKYGLEKVSRQSYQVRLDTMPKNLRARVEGTAKP